MNNGRALLARVQNAMNFILPPHGIKNDKGFEMGVRPERVLAPIHAP
jgi:hypothetical protein